MKKRYPALVALAVLLTAVPAAAAPISIDFSLLGVDVVSITAPASHQLSGVTFQYEPYDAASGDVADIFSGGIYGVAGLGTNDAGDPIPVTGILTMLFDSPSTGLFLDFFSVLSDAPDDFGLFALFDNGDGFAVPGNFVEVLDPEFGLQRYVSGSLAYTGGPFSVANVLFSQRALDFSVSNASYEPQVAQPVPEPTTLVLMGAGILGLTRLVRRRT